jgi:hypothetical protein
VSSKWSAGAVRRGDANLPRIGNRRWHVYVASPGRCGHCELRQPMGGRTSCRRPAQGKCACENTWTDPAKRCKGSGRGLGYSIRRRSVPRSERTLDELCGDQQTHLRRRSEEICGHECPKRSARQGAQKREGSAMHRSILEEGRPGNPRDNL